MVDQATANALVLSAVSTFSTPAPSGKRVVIRRRGEKYSLTSGAETNKTVDDYTFGSTAPRNYKQDEVDGDRIRRDDLWVLLAADGAKIEPNTDDRLVRRIVDVEDVAADSTGTGSAKFTRATGSFLDDGVRIDQELTIAGFASAPTNDGPSPSADPPPGWKVLDVSALEVTVEDLNDVIVTAAAATAQTMVFEREYQIVLVRPIFGVDSPSGYKLQLRA